MYSKNLRIHFSTLEAYQGFAAIEGVLRAEQEEVVMDYQIKDSLVGIVKSDQKELLLPYEEIEDFEYKRNWFISRLKITVFNLQLLEKFPASKNGQITLKIKRNQKEKMKDIVSYVRLRKSEINLDKMGE
ncbi:MAG: hypothetical protein AAF824_12470 [Bacteroidota bacterium]